MSSGLALGTLGEGLFELGCDEADPEAPFRQGYGGDTANTAVMAARLGARARLCGRVGADVLGRRLVAFWRRSGVDVGFVRQDDSAPTGLYVNERTRAGSHRFDYHRTGSAGCRLRPEDLEDGFFEELGVLHYSGVTLGISATAAEAARSAASRARRQGALISFTVNYRAMPGQDVSEIQRAALDADIVFGSREELEELDGHRTTDSAVDELTAHVPEVIVTDGGLGATIHAEGRSHMVEAPRVVVADASGAGDALAGAYLAARLAGAGPSSALRQGVAAASLSCTRPGCSLSYPSSAEIGEMVATLS